MLNKTPNTKNNRFIHKIQQLKHVHQQKVLQLRRQLKKGVKNEGGSLLSDSLQSLQHDDAVPSDHLKEAHKATKLKEAYRVMMRLQLELCSLTAPVFTNFKLTEHYSPNNLKHLFLLKCSLITINTAVREAQRELNLSLELICERIHRL